MDIFYFLLIMIIILGFGSIELDGYLWMIVGVELVIGFLLISCLVLKVFKYM